MSHPQPDLRWSPAACVLLIALAAALPARAGSPRSFGAHPLSETVASTWLGDEAGGALEPGLLVYFRGAPGWHARPWQSRASDPRDAEGAHSHALVSDTLTLELGVARDRATVSVQGRAFPSSGPNVFLVVLDDEGSEVSCILPIGRFRLDRSDEGVPLAVSAQTAHPRIAKKLRKARCGGR